MSAGAGRHKPASHDAQRPFPDAERCCSMSRNTSNEVGNLFFFYEDALTASSKVQLTTNRSPRREGSYEGPRVAFYL